MYAPHASPARERPAALDIVDLSLSDDSPVVPDSAVAPVTSIVGVLGAVAALWVAYGLLRPGPNRPTRTVWFAAALCLAGLTALIPLAGALHDARARGLGTVVTAAAAVVGASFLVGLMIVLRPAIGLARLRWILDIAIVWLCLTFSTWAFVAGHASVGISMPAAAAECLVLAAAAVIGVRARADDPGMALSAAGIWAAIGGLNSLALALAHQQSWGWLLLTATAFVAAPVLIWRGALAQSTTGPQPLVATSAPGARDATVTSAVVLAGFMGIDQLVDGEPIGWGPAGVGLIAIATLGIRYLSPVPPASDARAMSPAAPEPRPTLRPDLLARTDALTGLATRHQLSLVLAGWRCELRDPGALLAVGIDGLTDAPAAVRDEVLCEVTRRLTVAAGDRPPGECVTARFSTTRFAVLTRDTSLGAYGLASRLLSAFREPVSVGAQTLRLSPCVGLTRLAGAASTEDILGRAELALERARQAGPGRAEWYDPATEADMRRQESIVLELPGALRRGELDLIYQPIMDLLQERPLAVEALLRWRHPKLGTVLPADVVPVAEQIGVIADLNHWVLGQACTQLRSWRREGHDLSMAINISTRHMQTDELAAELSCLLAEHQLPADRLVLEVAEPSIEDGERLACHLGVLRSVGVRTALDEFGHGPESLTHLRRVPIDMVKIGQSFFAGPGASGDALTTPPVDVIVGVGRRIGVDVVAQGLEAPEQLATIRAAGCRFGQGHLFARPQPAERTEAYLATFRRRLA